MKIENLKKYLNKKIAIFWYGREGKSSLRLLKRLWAKDITILDKNEILEREEAISYETWENYLKNLWSFDLIIKAPGVYPYKNWVDNFKDKITSAVEIFVNNYEWKIIALTGTKGKSTTSTLTYKTLKNAWYKVKLVWNIWKPVLDEIDILWDEKYDYIVFEIWNYMLEWLKPTFYISYLNNIYDCHLDYHKNKKENYVATKKNIFHNSKHKIANIQTKEFLKDLENVTYFWDWTNFVYKDKKFFIEGKEVLKDENFLLKWEHNRKNITWILAILYAIYKDKPDSKWIFSKLINWLKETLESFSWLQNRQENIWTYKWITFIDDAIATTPESTMAAIKTFEQNIWTLLIWWEDSGFKFEELRETIYKYKIKNIVLFPDTGEKIFWDLSSFKYETIFDFKLKDLKIKICKTKSMDFAIDFAYKNTPEWKICLLSTAAPSFSLWNSYLHKSKEFQKSVKKLSK